MQEGTQTDKLAKVREAGKMIRSALAENMKARIGDVVEKAVLRETEATLAAVLKLYLEQIMPDVKVECHAILKPDVEKPEAIGFDLDVEANLMLSIAPGAEDDTLPDPVVEVEVPTTSKVVGSGPPKRYPDLGGEA